MKRFLRRVNLGLVLGGVLILATLLTILVTQVVFHLEKPTIQAAARDYLDDLAALNVTPAGRLPGGTLTDAEKNAKKMELEALLMEHWYSEPVVVGTTDLLFGNTAIGMEDVRTSYYNYLEIPLQGAFFDVSFTVLDSDITIQTNGPGYARVSIDVTDANAVGQGHPDALFPTGDPDFFTGDPESYPSAYELGKEYGTERYTARFAFYLELEMKRVDGEWRIINATSNCYALERVVDTEKEEAEK